MKNLVTFSLRLTPQELEALKHMANVKSVNQRRSIKPSQLLREALHKTYPELSNFNREATVEVAAVKA
jgi:hypothetical protein